MPDAKIAQLRFSEEKRQATAVVYLMKPSQFFDTESCISNSCFLHPNLSGPHGQTLNPRINKQKIQGIAKQMHNFILEMSHPCVGAQSVYRQMSYRWGIYDRIGDESAADGLARDLALFIEYMDSSRSDFTSFFAVFTEPVSLTQLEFENYLWKQLGLLDKRSRPHFRWNQEVSDDPTNPRFAFSFAENAFFVVGLHPGSSRLARAFAYPAIIFNPHSQFERLRGEGRFEQLKATIRKRDFSLQGSHNPMLSDFGSVSEASQYSGRKVEPGWQCPFRSAGPKQQGRA